MDRRFYEKHYTKVDPKYFEPIVEGMWQSVHKEGGTSRTAYLPGLDVCGKTGTAQNPRGKDHSTFLSFAPKDNPPHRYFGVCRERRVRGFGRFAHRQSARRVLFDRHRHTALAGGDGQAENDLLPGLWKITASVNCSRGVDRWTVSSLCADRAGRLRGYPLRFVRRGGGEHFFLLAFLYETARLDGNIVRRSGRRVAGRCEHLSQVGLSVLCPGIADPGSRSAVRS